MKSHSNKNIILTFSMLMVASLAVSATSSSVSMMQDAAAQTTGLEDITDYNSKPIVTDSKLQIIFDELYRPDGHAGDALIKEFKTGLPTGKNGEFHAIKVMERLKGIAYRLYENPPLSDADKKIAQEEAKKLVEAANTPPSSHPKSQQLKEEIENWSKNYHNQDLDSWNAYKKLVSDREMTPGYTPDMLSKFKKPRISEPGAIHFTPSGPSYIPYIPDEIGGAANIVADNAGKLSTIAKQIDNKLPVIGAASTLIDFHKSMQSGDREGAIASFVDLSGQAVTGIGTVTLQPEIVALGTAISWTPAAVSIVRTGVEMYEGVLLKAAAANLPCDPNASSTLICKIGGTECRQNPVLAADVRCSYSDGSWKAWWHGVLMIACPPNGLATKTCYMDHYAPFRTPLSPFKTTPISKVSQVSEPQRDSIENVALEEANFISLVDDIGSVTDNPPTNPSTNPPTNPSTNPPTNPSTNPPTNPSTNPPTNPSTNPPTEPPQECPEGTVFDNGECVEPPPPECSADNLGQEPCKSVDVECTQSASSSSQINCTYTDGRYQEYTGDTLSGECGSDGKCSRFNTDGSLRCDAGNVGTIDCKSDNFGCEANPILTHVVNCGVVNDEGDKVADFTYINGQLAGEHYYGEQPTFRSKNVISDAWTEWSNGTPSNPIDPVTVVDQPLNRPSSQPPALEQVATTDPAAMQVLPTDPLLVDPTLPLPAPPMTPSSLEPLATVNPALATPTTDPALATTASASAPGYESNMEPTSPAPEVGPSNQKTGVEAVTEPNAQNSAAVSTETVNNNAQPTEVQDAPDTAPETAKAESSAPVETSSPTDNTGSSDSQNTADVKSDDSSNVDSGDDSGDIRNENNSDESSDNGDETNNSVDTTDSTDTTDGNDPGEKSDESADDIDNSSGSGDKGDSGSGSQNSDETKDDNNGDDSDSNNDETEENTDDDDSDTSTNENTNKEEEEEDKSNDA